MPHHPVDTPFPPSFFPFRDYPPFLLHGHRIVRGVQAPPMIHRRPVDQLRPMLAPSLTRWGLRSSRSIVPRRVSRQHWVTTSRFRAYPLKVRRSIETPLPPTLVVYHLRSRKTPQPTRLQGVLHSHLLLFNSTLPPWRRGLPRFPVNASMPIFPSRAPAIPSRCRIETGLARGVTARAGHAGKTVGGALAAYRACAGDGRAAGRQPIFLPVMRKRMRTAWAANQVRLCVQVAPIKRHSTRTVATLKTDSFLLVLTLARWSRLGGPPKPLPLPLPRQTGHRPRQTGNPRQRSGLCLFLAPGVGQAGSRVACLPRSRRAVRRWGRVMLWRW